MQSNNPYFIGIDGGGTKTEAMLCNREGTILAKSIAGSTNIKSRSEEEVRKAIQQVVTMLTGKLAPGYIEAIFVTTAGGDRIEDQTRWKQWLLEALPDFNGEITITNDAYGALASGTFSMEGTVLIAGTGSIAYSISKNKSIRRAGGWGYLFGDDGSGYDIGRQALRLLTAMHDGLVERDDVFRDGLLSFLALRRAPDLITAIYEDSYPRLKIASLAECVITLAKQGNDHALSILTSASESLVRLLKAIRNGNESVVVCGGLFQSEHFCRVFEKELRDNQFQEKIFYPELSPAVGACICALIHNGHSLTEDMKKNLMSSFRSIEGSYT